MSPTRRKTDPSRDSGRHGAVTGPGRLLMLMLLTPLGYTDADCSSVPSPQTCVSKQTRMGEARLCMQGPTSSKSQPR